MTRGLIVGILLAVLPQAAGYGVDHRPCVSRVEFQGFRGIPDGALARRDIEARWEVRGRGKVFIPLLGWSVRYPMCGYSLREAWVAVTYEKGVAWAASAWKADAATLHGQP